MAKTHNKGEQLLTLTLKALTTIAADDSLEYFFLVFRENKPDISRESSAGHRIHMKHQDLYNLKDKRKKTKVSPAAILLGSLRVRSY